MNGCKSLVMGFHSGGGKSCRLADAPPAGPPPRAGEAVCLHVPAWGAENEKRDYCRRMARGA